MAAIERAARCRAAQVWCVVLAKLEVAPASSTAEMAGLKLALLALIAVASSQEYEPPQQETAFDDEFHDVPPPIRPPVAAKRIIKNSDGEPVLEVPLNFNLNLTVLRHHAGEAAVGASAGAIAAFIARRIQSTALLLSVLGGVGTAAALHLKWVSPAQVSAHSIFSRLNSRRRRAATSTLTHTNALSTKSLLLSSLSHTGAAARDAPLPLHAAEALVARRPGGPRRRRRGDARGQPDRLLARRAGRAPAHGDDGRRDCGLCQQLQRVAVIEAQL